VRDLLSERLGLPVFVDNDANVALLAEHRRGAAGRAGTR
jgi:predicted NBD/HSP70 family sugar kinase